MAPSPLVRQLGENALVIDADALLLSPETVGAPLPRSRPVEAGGYIRGLVLLLALYPVLPVPSHEPRAKAMALRLLLRASADEAARIGSAVLHGQALLSARLRTCTRLSKALVALPCKEVKAWWS